MKENTKDVPEKFQPFSIPLEDAQEMICNWRKSNAYKETGKFKAFHIPYTEINEFMEMYKGKGVGVRAYIGLANPEEEQILSTNLKLIFVATEEALFPVPFSKDIISEIDGKKVAFDLSTPCPIDCDIYSPLNAPPQCSGLQDLPPEL